MEYNKDSIVFVEGFASKEDCKVLADYLETTDDIWNQGSKSVHYIDYIGSEHDGMAAVEDDDVIDTARKLTAFVQQYIEENYLPTHGVNEFKKFNNRGLELVKWKEYVQLNPHSDGPDQPPAYPMMSFGTLIYLNDDYDGGEIGFDQFDLAFKPSVGSLVIFPNHLIHHVKPVMPLDGKQTARRYTLPVFWLYSEDPNHAYSGSYTQTEKVKAVENGAAIYEQE